MALCIQYCLLVYFLLPTGSFFPKSCIEWQLLSWLWTSYHDTQPIAGRPTSATRRGRRDRGGALPLPGGGGGSIFVIRKPPRTNIVWCEHKPLERQNCKLSNFWLFLVPMLVYWVCTLIIDLAMIYIGLAMIFVARKAPVPLLSLLRPSWTRKRQPFRWKSQKWWGRVRCKRTMERITCLGSGNFRNVDPFIPILFHFIPIWLYWSVQDGSRQQ